MMNIVQQLLYGLEVGKARVLIRIIPLLVTFTVVLGLYDFSVYRGLDDEQSMDNAQVARQLVRGEGFTTKFLRPYALNQLRLYKTAQSALNGTSADLFPASEFPPGSPRLVPDTYNAPGYPYLLAGWFRIVRPQFVQDHEEIAEHHKYSGDRWIPEFNQIFVFLTMVLVFVLGRRLFDERVAWFSAVTFVLSDIIWKFSITALSTNILMLLFMGLLICATEIFTISEQCFQSEEASFTPAWFWTLLLSLLLAAACLMRLHLLVLLVPVMFFLALLPRPQPMTLVIVMVVAAISVGPWFWHVYQVCGNPLGSNLPLLLYGEDENYKGNQIFCTSVLPSYDSLFKDASKKEFLGFLWHYEHWWSLLGSNPMILLFMASMLHQFKRSRAQTFRWLLVGFAVCLIGANNLCVDQMEPVSSWNTLIVLFPAMLVIGSAYFFILLDRLNMQIPLLGTTILVTTLLLTSMPLINTLTESSNKFYNFPPYAPPYVNLIGRLARTDEWVTSDMPWATAWYADRASLWIPDSLNDFLNLHDNVCPSGVLLLTPVTLSVSAADLTKGEYKDWFPFVTGFNVPAHFPLNVHTVTESGGPDYSVWSDRARWQVAPQ